MGIAIQTASGTQVLPWLDAVAALRIEVFRDFPYLYDGTLDYERRYLATYASTADSLFVLALDGDKVVGASTGIPLVDAEPEFQAPFMARQIPLENVFYFGESVLQRRYRGHGLGHRFFDARETFAATLGKSITAFCAVERPDNHPLRPAHYTPLEAFWQQRGYSKQPGMRALYAWQDIGEPRTTDKSMVFWLKNRSKA
jgi:GNAT superfamily N-acetyltransferase